MKKHKTLKAFSVYLLILLGLSFALAYSMTDKTDKAIQQGMLSGITVGYTKKGVMYYNIEGSRVTPYDTYSNALQMGAYNQLLFAENGLLYKHNTPIGRQIYIIDYSWLNNNKYNEQAIKKYVRHHTVIMTMRGIYLSGVLSYGVILYAVFLLLAKVFTPIALLLFTTTYMFFKKLGLRLRGNLTTDSERAYENAALGKSLLNKLILNRMAQTYDLEVLLGVLSYSLTTGALQNIVAVGSYGFLLSLVVVCILLIVIKQSFAVYLDIDFRRLTANLKQHPDPADTPPAKQEPPAKDEPPAKQEPPAKDEPHK